MLNNLLMAVLDTTLREGEQRWGIYFSAKVRREIVRRLVALGVEEIELGTVGCHQDLVGLAAFVRELSPGLPVSVWAPLRTADLRAAMSLGAVRLNLGVPVSPLQRERRLGLGRQELIKRVRRVVRFAADLFPYVSLGLEDASRTEKDFLLEVGHAAFSAGARRLRLSDTLGILEPAEVMHLVRSFKESLPGVELAFHAHNDFGLASANALTALSAGADWVDASVLGLGERAGIARLEEILAYLYLRKGKIHYRIQLLPEICHFVSWHAGDPCSEFKPIIGRKLFYCETGLHVEALYKTPALYEPFPPELFGLERRLGLGAKSGRAALKRTLERLGLRLRRQELSVLLEEVRRRSRECGRPLSEKELRELANKGKFVS